VRQPAEHRRAPVRRRRGAGTPTGSAQRFRPIFWLVAAGLLLGY
jgi:hypothetical protein